MKSTSEILAATRAASARAAGSATLVGVSGIDGSGKGYVAARLERELTDRGARVATINIDGWLEAPSRRFGRPGSGAPSPADHFYRHGIRLDEMFARLVLPLRDHRSHALAATLYDASSDPTGRRHEYDYRDVDVVLVEGIFIFKPAYRDRFDLRYWVDCTFETALERALARNQEGLPPGEIVRDYETTYFPAQRIHLEDGDPRESCHGIIVNDHRLMTSAAPRGSGRP